MKVTALFLALSSLLSCTSETTVEAPGIGLKRSALLTDTDLGMVALSPSGRYVAYTRYAPDARLEIKPADGKSGPVRSLAGVSQWAWTKSGDQVLAIVPEQGHDRLVVVSPETGERTVPLSNSPRLRLVDTSAALPDAAAITVTAPAQNGLFKVDLQTGKLEAISDQRFNGWLLDGSLKPVAGMRSNGIEVHLFGNFSDGWRQIANESAIYVRSVGLVSAMVDGSKFFFTGYEGTDRSVLVEVDRTTGSKKVVAQDERADLLPVGAWIDPATGRPDSVGCYSPELKQVTFSEGSTSAFAKAAKSLSGHLSFAGVSKDEKWLLIRHWEGGPASYHLVDLASGKATEVLRELQFLDPSKLNPRSQRFIQSRDGLNLPIAIYTPRGSDANGDRLPDKPLPTVVLVHGGPWIGYDWNFWPVIRNFQLLADRGYVVIRAGFRGEPGFGKKFVEASYKQWGLTMQNDLEDIADYAVKKGIAAKDKIAIWGWSYGGYAAAQALSTSDRFACAISMFGVFDLEAIQRRGIGNNRFWWDRIFDPNVPAELELMRKLSPTYNIDRLSKPILVTHGGRDDRVPISQSDDYAKKLDAAGKSTTYLRFPTETHDYPDVRSWIAFWAVAERFLAEQIGGGYEPMSDELKAVTIEVPVGKDRIPGLAQALG